MAEIINEFSDICPYSDEQAKAAFAKLAESPLAINISKTLFPDKGEDFLKNVLSQIETVDQFQKIVILQCIEWVIKNSVKEFSFDGVENMHKVGGRYLSVSNHRDIVVDPAVTQYVMHINGLETSQLCVGDNLLLNPYVDLVLRSNKMIKVIRGVGAREMYKNSMTLSKYIRKTIASGESSVWIAQREGRAKNGLDVTEQGILKMFDMSGSGDFVADFMELNILPISISYEYEPCDYLKARELCIRKRVEKYVKGPDEDFNSIMTGIRQWKGNVHLSVCEPLSKEEIEAAALLSKNERYQSLKHAIDKRIIKGYRLWKNNYIAYDIVNSGDKYASQYTAEEKAAFESYVEKQLDLIEPELPRTELKDIFLHIYSNPVQSFEEFTM